MVAALSLTPGGGPPRSPARGGDGALTDRGRGKPLFPPIHEHRPQSSHDARAPHSPPDSTDSTWSNSREHSTHLPSIATAARKRPTEVHFPPIGSHGDKANRLQVPGGNRGHVSRLRSRKRSQRFKDEDEAEEDTSTGRAVLTREELTELLKDIRQGFVVRTWFSSCIMYSCISRSDFRYF